ncbi:MAG: LysR family transcriptional regulator [Ruminococcaceae bacterium]|nr:LysR family transcriptional regulator [Oscillospiraceae bacterium]
MVTLQQLQYFHELAANGHLTRTAEKLYISQTTLSNTIINLEKQLGIKLFNRVGRTLQLSEAGTKYLEYVSQALGALENGRAYIEDYREKGERRISLTTGNALVWAGLVRGFQDRFRDYSIRQLNSTPDQFRRMLLDMEVDFAITGTDDLSLSGLEYQVIREEPLFLCVSKDHPLSARDSITLNEIRDENFINLPPSLPFRKYCDDLFRTAGIQYHAALECDYMLRGQLIEAGFGVALTTQSGHIAGLLGNNNHFIPLSDCPPRPIAIIWNPKRYMGRAALDFREYVLTLDYMPYSGL